MTFVAMGSKCRKCGDVYSLDGKLEAKNDESSNAFLNPCEYISGAYNEIVCDRCRKKSFSRVFNPLRWFS